MRRSTTAALAVASAAALVIAGVQPASAHHGGEPVSGSYSAGAEHAWQRLPGRRFQQRQAHGPDVHRWDNAEVVREPTRKIILASRSPRRSELLTAAGISFEVLAADIDETPHANEAPAAYVERLAREKAAAIARRWPDAVVVAADTAVVLDGQVLGKPVDAADAARMLRDLGGRAHDVLTGVAVAAAGQTHARVERTVVWMHDWPAEDIERSVASGEPLDKAGAYALQGYAARFIPRIDGSPSNVVGLPLEAVVQLLASADVSLRG